MTDAQVKKTSKKPNRADRFGGPGPGRPKGSKNKFTDLKDSFLNVYKQLGGDEALAEWAGKNQSNLGMFYKILSKMLPSNIGVEHSGNIPGYIIPDKAIPKMLKQAKKESDAK